jgi:serine protease Do
MATRKSSLFYGLLIAVTSLVVGMVIASRLDLTPLSSAANGPLTIPVTNSEPLEGPIDAGTFRNIARLAGPAVVSIQATSMREVRSSRDSIQEFFGFPVPQAPGPQGRGQQEGPQEVPQTGTGSGFIIDRAGYILTNNHVVEGATSIEVRLSTMHELEYGLAAKVIGRDELTDTALLQLTELPSAPLPVAKFGDSAQMAPGDWVMAIGSPFNLSNTVTVGIVSAVGRQNQVARGRTEDFIQTDAAINRGNSGGPLLNVRGEVIGINTMIITGDQFAGGNIGVGFAVPINTVRDLLPQLHEGKVTRGRIGVTITRRPLSEQDAKDLGLPSVMGAEVASVERGGPAGQAGLRAGDIITEINGKPVRDNNALVSMVMATRPGTTVPVKLVRNKQTMTLNVTVGELDLAAEQQVERTTDTAPRAEEPRSTGFGMSITPVTPQVQRQARVPTGQGGAVIAQVTPFGPAAEAGLAPGDVLLSIQGQAVSTPDAVTAAIDAIPTGRVARVIVWRFAGGEGQELLFQVRKR